MNYKNIWDSLNEVTSIEKLIFSPPSYRKWVTFFGCSILKTELQYIGVYIEVKYIKVQYIGVQYIGVQCIRVECIRIQYNPGHWDKSLPAA